MEKSPFPVIVALDKYEEGERDKLIETARQLSGRVWGFKIHDAIDTFGYEIIPILKQFGKVFVDAKLHDTPDTVRVRADRLINQHGADLVTVHAAGGKEMLEAAVQGAGGGEKLAAVTSLTSDPDASQVIPRAILAQSVGIKNIICSPLEAADVKREAPGLFVITPGIRGPDDPAGDQVRKATPQQALDAGADLLVIGQPIVQSTNPLAALLKLMGIKS